MKWENRLCSNHGIGHSGKSPAGSRAVAQDGEFRDKNNYIKYKGNFYWDFKRFIISNFIDSLSIFILGISNIFSKQD